MRRFFLLLALVFAPALGGQAALAAGGGPQAARDARYDKRAADKFVRVRALRRGLMARIRADVAQTLRTPQRDQATAIAVAIALMDETTMRPGSKRFTAPHGKNDQRTFGAVSLLGSHFPNERRYDFVGKASKRWKGALRNPQLAAALALFRAGAGPDQPVLRWVTASGETRVLHEADVRHALRERYGDVLPKDIRTTRANEILLHTLRAARVPRSLVEAEATLKRAITRVARQLNHTVSACRSSYLDYQTLLETPLAAYALSQRLIPAPALVPAP